VHSASVLPALLTDKLRSNPMRARNAVAEFAPA